MKDAANLHEQFQEYVKHHKLFSRHQKLLLAFSGGVDSVCLLDLLYRAGFEITLAHCNFQLRGTASDGDEKFTFRIAKELGIEAISKKFTLEQKSCIEITHVQEQCRKLRYDWFEELCESGGFKLVLTAHHGNDQVETVLRNLIHGTGIQGLSGMSPKRGRLVRPLLFTNKEVIERYVKKRKLRFRNDATNKLKKYERNRIRMELIPLLEKYNPGFQKSFLRSISYFQDTERLYHKSVEQSRKKLIEKRGKDYFVSIRKLIACDSVSTIVYELLKPFGFVSSQVDEVLKLLDAPTGKQVLSSTYRVFKDRNGLIVTSKRADSADFILVEKEDRNVEFELGKFRLLEKEIGKIGRASCRERV